MKILVFGGTEEGRVLASNLCALGAEVAVSVATPLGAEELSGIEGAEVLVGRLDAKEMAALLRRFDLCIDATHPYSTAVSANITAACEETGVERRRLLREQSAPEGCTLVDDTASAVEFLKEREGNVLLMTGSKTVGEYAPLGAERLFVRILPTHESLSLCEAAGIPHKHIIAMQGPFTRKMNEATIEQYAIRFIVTRDGGAAGGFDEKLSAARACGAEAIVIRRPKDVGESMEEILHFVRKRL